MSASQIVPHVASVLGVMASVCAESDGLVSTWLGTSLTEVMHATALVDDSASAVIRPRARESILFTHIKSRDPKVRRSCGWSKKGRAGDLSKPSKVGNRSVDDMRLLHVRHVACVGQKDVPCAG
jgi:hypothetical protein